MGKEETASYVECWQQLKIRAGSCFSTTPVARSRALENLFKFLRPWFDSSHQSSTMMHLECHGQGQVSLASSTPKLSHPIYDAGKIPTSLMSCFLSRFISKIIRSLANEKTSIEESSIDSVFDAMFLLPFSILDRRLSHIQKTHRRTTIPS